MWVRVHVSILDHLCSSMLLGVAFVLVVWIPAHSVGSSHLLARRPFYVAAPALNNPSSIISNSTLSQTSWNYFLARNSPSNNARSALPLVPHPRSGDGGSDSSNSKKDKGFKLEIPQLVEYSMDPRVLLPDALMLRILGGERFDKELTSINLPQEELQYPNGRLYARIMGEHELDLKALEGIWRTYENLPYSATLKPRLNRMKQRGWLAKFLTAYTLCPIEFIWRDLGERYWPRWIRVGRCASREGQSCSIPPGMKCQEYQRREVTLLRYFCLRTWHLKDCGWKRFVLPVLTDCRCACGA